MQVLQCMNQYAGIMMQASIFRNCDSGFHIQELRFMLQYSEIAIHASIHRKYNACFHAT